MTGWNRLHRIVLAVIVGLLAVSGKDASKAQVEEPPAKQSRAPLAKFLTVTSPVDDVMFGKVNNVALALQNQAEQENRRGVLVLEIEPGSSQFLQVYRLAKFLTSVKLSKVTTVAWIPKTVTGHNVVLALAANEIIMHPDAELGDIGRGQALEKDEQQLVLNMIDKRHNKKLSPALVRGMMDPQQIVNKVTLIVGDPEKKQTESRVVTPQEHQELLDNQAIIRQVEPIKGAGEPGVFSGEQARALDVLIVQTALSRDEVADLYDIPHEAMREDPTSGEAPRARRILIHDMIEPILETFVERQIQRSVAAGANLLIFEIDSPGGFLLSSKNLAYAIADLDPKQVRTVAYVPKEALSGAAIIALGCDEIYMHPRAIIGDAGPIEIKEGGQFERAPEKILSVLREMLRELAEKKNRPPALTMAMADKDLVVYEATDQKGRIHYMTDDEIHDANEEFIKGRAVPESKLGKLLTLNGDRAHELKLARPPVKDLEELKVRLGIPAGEKLVAVGRTWVDTLIFVLNTKAAMFLLIVIGVVCLYLELHMMVGLLGIISALCFGLFFWSRFLGGTATWLEIMLFLMGLACIGLEIFVIPGFGVFGLSGGLLVIASLVLTSQTLGDFGGPSTDLDRMTDTMGTLTAAIVSVIGLAMVISRYLPHMPILNQMILTPPGMNESDDAEEPRLRPEYAGPGGLVESLLGRQGEALSMLRPAGKAQIDDHYVDVVSDGPYIPQGSLIEVITVSGNRIVVRQV